MPIVSVPLTQGKTAIIDAEDAERVLRHRWHAVFTGDGWYVRTKVAGRDVYLHRFLTDAVPQVRIDHKNGDGLDNRRENLRPCSNGQNMRNRSGPQSNNKSGYLGVCWSKKREKWHAQIEVDGKNVSLGGFETAKEAAMARDVAARRYHGEFASLNFPDDAGSGV